MSTIRWNAPARVQAFVTTRANGDMAAQEARAKLQVPAPPRWLKQVHGARVLVQPTAEREADAAVTRDKGVVCAVMTADCLPVFLAERSGRAVGVAHAGWRGLCAGVIEAAVAAMGTTHLAAWLGPAIGPRVYEVGDEVRARFLAADPAAAVAFVPNRPGHWLLDLYTVARQRLARAGVTDVSGGGFCTYTERERFYSYRREGATGRMAALIWIE
ncbi:MAG: peptidoglycan editing factor PgeF [Betaproteobacteria bacterium]